MILFILGCQSYTIQPKSSVLLNNNAQSQLNNGTAIEQAREEKKYFGDETIARFETLTCNDIIPLETLNSKFAKKWEWSEAKPKINVPISISYDPVTKTKSGKTQRERDLICIYKPVGLQEPNLKIGVTLKEDTLDWKTFVDAERQRIQTGGIVFDIAQRKLKSAGDMIRETNDVGNNYFEYVHPVSKNRTYTIIMVDSSKRFIVSFVLQDDENSEESSKLNDLEIIKGLFKEINNNLQKIPYRLKEG